MRFILFTTAILAIADCQLARAEVYEINGSGAMVETTNRVAIDFVPEVQRPQAQPIFSTARFTPGRHPYGQLIAETAQRYSLSHALLDAVVWQESRYRANAKSPVGAYGLMQLMPATARSLGVTDSSDPAQNLAGGAAYLRMQLNRFDNDLERALAAYNAGPGAVIKHGGIPPYRETRNYVRSIMERLAQSTLQAQK